MTTRREDEAAVRSNMKAYLRRYRFEQIPLDSWRAANGQLGPGEVAHLRQRKQAFAMWRAVKACVLLPAVVLRALRNLLGLLADLERLHSGPRRRMREGRGCVLDRSTWLVNGSNIELGDHVKLSAFSALIAGFEAKITIGDYTIIGPGVFVVAANHGIAMDGIPIRYQNWKEKSVVIEDDVWIGANAVVLPGTRIGQGSVIGASAVVSGDIPAHVIVHQDKGNLIMRARP